MAKNRNQDRDGGKDRDARENGYEDGDGDGDGDGGHFAVSIHDKYPLTASRKSSARFFRILYCTRVSQEGKSGAYQAYL